MFHVHCRIIQFGILGHQFNKRLESFASYYSQSLLYTTGGFERKPYSDLKIPSNKIRETRKLEFVYELHFVEWKNEGRKPDKNRD
jgi:hypothetical protein